MPNADIPYEFDPDSEPDMGEEEPENREEKPSMSGFEMTCEGCADQERYRQLGTFGPTRAHTCGMGRIKGARAYFVGLPNLPTSPATTPSTPEPEFVDHPQHYNEHPSGVECIDIVETFSFNVGSAIKYLWRAGLKPGTHQQQDYEKAVWYINREISRLKKLSGDYNDEDEGTRDD